MHLCTRILGDMGHTWDSGGTYISRPSSARARRPAPAPPATRESGDHTYRDMHLERCVSVRRLCKVSMFEIYTYSLKVPTLNPIVSSFRKKYDLISTGAQH